MQINYTISRCLNEHVPVIGKQNHLGRKSGCISIFLVSFLALKPNKKNKCVSGYGSENFWKGY